MSRKDRFYPQRRLRWVGGVVTALLALTLLGATVTAAENTESTESDSFFERRGINDRAGFFIGGVASTVDTRAQINPDFGVGSSIELERIFGLPSERDYPRFQGYWRFNRKHRINFQYLRAVSSGTTTLLDEEITIGNETFELNAQIGAEQDTRFAAVEYRYAFVNNGRAEAGLSAGLGFIDANLELFGEVNVGPLTQIAKEQVNEIIPLPVAGIYVDFTLTRRLFLSVDALIFSANYDKYSGNIDDSRMALRWYPTKIFGFGAAWNRTRIDLTIAEDRGDIHLDYLFEGPELFISFLVPGLK